jgi:hypothetical protein
VARIVRSRDPLILFVIPMCELSEFVIPMYGSAGDGESLLFQCTEPSQSCFVAQVMPLTRKRLGCPPLGAFGLRASVVEHFQFGAKSADLSSHCDGNHLAP